MKVQQSSFSSAVGYVGQLGKRAELNLPDLRIFLRAFNPTPSDTSAAYTAHSQVESQKNLISHIRLWQPWLLSLGERDQLSYLGRNVPRLSLQSSIGHNGQSLVTVRILVQA